MPELVGVVEDEVSVWGRTRGCQLRAAGAMPYCEIVEVVARMRRVFIIAVCACVVSWNCRAQDAAAPVAPAKGTSLIGCLAGPDADDHYTLTSMQHRMGVEVVGGEELKKGAGAKVKLTGSWEALPGPQGKKGDATRRFKATEIAVVEEKCQAPAPVTPMSKKKQAEKQAQQQQQAQQK